MKCFIDIEKKLLEDSTMFSREPAQIDIKGLE